LQARGASNASATLRRLRRACLGASTPGVDILKAGLDWLQQTDLRQDFCRLRCPLLMIFGEYDMIVKKNILENLIELDNGVETTLISGAGHAPFISHLPEFAGSLNYFVQRLSGIEQGQTDV